MARMVCGNRGTRFCKALEAVLQTGIGMSNTNAQTALPEDPPTPIWELILEQFKDQLVIILLGSAAVSFVLALFEQEEGWTAFVDPAVVCAST